MNVTENSHHSFFVKPGIGLTVGDVASGPFCNRDAVLCPVHARELEGMLKDIGNELKDVRGSA